MSDKETMSGLYKELLQLDKKTKQWTKLNNGQKI